MLRSTICRGISPLWFLSIMAPRPFIATVRLAKRKIDGSILSPWRFSSKRSDASTGLVYYGRRYYMPTFGRWLTPDPAGFTDGMNLYAFVHNDPLTHFDEYGLWLESRSPGYFSSSQAFQLMTNPLISMYNNPRFQGSMQAFGGLVETGVGAGMTYGSGGILAPIGWALMAHGLDHTITGMNTSITGRPRETVTAQLLQKTGMSSRTAGLVDDGVSMIGTMGGAAAMRAGQAASFPNYMLPTRASSNGRNHQTLYRAVKPEELADIQKTGTFRNLGYAEGKYFTTSIEGASSYAKQAVKGLGDPPYTLIKTRTSNNIFDGVSPALVDRGIPAWVIPDQRLEGLIPEVMNWMAVPK